MRKVRNQPNEKGNPQHFKKPTQWSNQTPHILTPVLTTTKQHPRQFYLPYIFPSSVSIIFLLPHGGYAWRASWNAFSMSGDQTPSASSLEPLLQRGVWGSYFIDCNVRELLGKYCPDFYMLVSYWENTDVNLKFKKIFGEIGGGSYIL